MEEKRTFTENPEEDLWSELLQFSYAANIEKYFADHSITPEQENVIDSISGSFLQAYEYYKAGGTSNLQISPLLLYYGTTNLLYGMASLIDGKFHVINNHGMKVNSSTIENFISDASITFENQNTGGVHVFCKSLKYDEDLTKTGSWRLADFLASIAEIEYDYKKCYGVPSSNVIYLDSFYTPTGMVEKIYFNNKNKKTIVDLISKIDEFSKTYFRIQEGTDIDGNNHFILRRKMSGKDISRESYSGQKYLVAPFTRSGKNITLPSIIDYYASLFILGSLCRYHPEIWSPFVLKDKSGERLLIERLLYYAKRLIPNMVLDIIYGYKTTYVTERYSIKNTIKPVGEHEVKELVNKEVFNQLRNNDFRK